MGGGGGSHRSQPSSTPTAVYLRMYCKRMDGATGQEDAGPVRLAVGGALLQQTSGSGEVRAWSKWESHICIFLAVGQ